MGLYRVIPIGPVGKLVELVISGLKALEAQKAVFAIGNFRPGFAVEQ